MREKLAFIGAGTQADATFQILDKNQYRLVGYFDDKDINDHDGFPILGKIDEVSSFLASNRVDRIFITIGDNCKRAEIFEQLRPKFYDRFINIVSNTAIILSQGSLQGRGIFISSNAVVGAKVVIGDNTIVNTSAVVEHHTKVGAHVNVAPHATVNGVCMINDGCYLGSGSVIIQVKSIAPWSLIGAGAVVVKDIHEAGTYVGVPAKLLRKEG